LIVSREDFGPTLKARREQRGVTLDAIARSTKITASLLVALERNDLSRWPRGIYRRAYMREYLSAIGLPAEPWVTEFTRLFPDDSLGEPVDKGCGLALTLDVDPRAAVKAMWLRLAIASIELCAVLLVGAIAWALGASFWIASGTVGLIYYPVANVCVERTLCVRSLASLITLRPFAWSRAYAARGNDRKDELPSAAQLETAN
jgi:transcriptional regulator with XRE-family HTH domain